MQKVPSSEYIAKAKKLSRDEAEQLLSRMRRKMARRMEDKELTPLEAVALQLEKEDEDIDEWRKQWAKISAREEKREKQKK